MGTTPGSLQGDTVGSPCWPRRRGGLGRGQAELMIGATVGGRGRIRPPCGAGLKDPRQMRDDSGRYWQIWDSVLWIGDTLVDLRNRPLRLGREGHEERRGLDLL
jgi:hypothetical protein